MKKTILFFAVMLSGFWAMAQGVLIGTVIDAETKETLIGASIYNEATKSGTTTDLNGRFRLNGSSGTELVISFMGYQTDRVTMTAGQEIVIALKSEAISIQGANIIADVAVARKTPVAISTISPIAIEEKLGSQEFPEILKSTPGVYATKQGGGFGDSRINLRGFESTNIAVMINGIPINGMENGRVYWSNWAGLSDVTRSMQVQRGLGAAKVSAPSVGGTINIVTRTTDAKRGGVISYALGNDGYNKISFSASTGMSSNGWAATILGAKTWGDGYIQGTAFEGYSYFVNVSKQINTKHMISLTGFGAPQWHDQRVSKSNIKISEWQKVPGKYKFNPTHGYDMNGQKDNSGYNYYHKPQISLNHYWTINDKINLSTALYASIASGGGQSGQGYTSNDRYLWDGASNGLVNNTFRTPDGFFDYAGVYKYNQESTTGSKMVMSNSVNDHQWYGLISTASIDLSQELTLSGGIDLRYYKGVHTNEITDLYGGAYFIDATSNRPLLTDQSWATRKLGVGDVVYRDYDGFVVQEGIFAQLEYSKNDLSAFVSGSLNNNTYWRYDRFYYDSDQARSETMNYLGYMIKGGANYNISQQHNVFANIGYFSRAPFIESGAFLNSTTSNITNPNAVNEKVFSAEIGYGFRSRIFSANLNAYRTAWNDKTLVRAIDANSPASLVVNMEGVDAEHYGVELDFTVKPIDRIEIKGMVSWGDWKWKNDAKGYLYNREGQPTDQDGNIVEIGSAKHKQITVFLDGIRVGNSAQFTSALGINIEILRGFRIGFDANYYGKNYANYNISETGSSISDAKFSQPWRIPDAIVCDANLSYRFELGKLKSSIFFNLNNVFNQEYIADAYGGVEGDWNSPSVFYGFGRTWSVGLKVNF